MDNIIMIGDWGLGIGDWPNPQSPIPNPQINKTYTTNIFININNQLYTKIILLNLILYILLLSTMNYYLYYFNFLNCI